MSVGREWSGGGVVIVAGAVEPVDEAEDAGAVGTGAKLESRLAPTVEQLGIHLVARLERRGAIPRELAERRRRVDDVASSIV